MKRQIIWTVSLLFMMFIGMQKSYAHGHHDINHLQSHDSDVNVAVTEVMETLDSENHEVTLLSKVASKAKKNSTTFAILSSPTNLN